MSIGGLSDDELEALSKVGSLAPIQSSHDATASKPSFTVKVVVGFALIALLVGAAFSLGYQRGRASTLLAQVAVAEPAAH